MGRKKAKKKGKKGLSKTKPKRRTGITWSAVEAAINDEIKFLNRSKHFKGVEWDLDFDSDDQKLILTSLRAGKSVEMQVAEQPIRGIMKSLTLYVGADNRGRITAGCPVSHFVSPGRMKNRQKNKKKIAERRKKKTTKRTLKRRKKK